MTNQVWTPIRHVHAADQWVAAASRQDFVDAAHADADYADEHGRVRTRLIFDSNGQGISLARTNPEFRAALDHGDVIHDFAKACEESGRTFYLLGGPEETNAECAQLLEKMYRA